MAPEHDRKARERLLLARYGDQANLQAASELDIYRTLEDAYYEAKEMRDEAQRRLQEDHLQEEARLQLRRECEEQHATVKHLEGLLEEQAQRVEAEFKQQRLERKAVDQSAEQFVTPDGVQRPERGHSRPALNAQEKIALHSAIDASEPLLAMDANGFKQIEAIPVDGERWQASEQQFIALRERCDAIQQRFHDEHLTVDQQIAYHDELAVLHEQLEVSGARLHERNQQEMDKIILPWVDREQVIAELDVEQTALSPQVDQRTDDVVDLAAMKVNSPVVEPRRNHARQPVTRAEAKLSLTASDC